jgi:hypothetical protein
LRLPASPSYCIADKHFLASKVTIPESAWQEGHWKADDHKSDTPPNATNGPGNEALLDTTTPPAFTALSASVISDLGPSTEPITGKGKEQASTLGVSTSSTFVGLESHTMNDDRYEDVMQCPPILHLSSSPMITVETDHQVGEASKHLPQVVPEEFPADSAKKGQVL